MKGCAAIAAGAVALAASVSAAPQVQKRSLTPVSVKGNAFYAGDERFFIRGVDYQPGGSSLNVDPLADPDTCKRDIPYFQQLGINTVRVYSVDNSKDHDECMNALADAGIYLAMDVNNNKYSLNRESAATIKQSYNSVYLQSVFATIDMFQKYDNTLLFFSGNEVINTPENTNTAPYIKAVGRDMKAYIAARGYRQIPVGYSAADIVPNRYQTAAYMNCGPDDVRSDFFAFNSYEWCGHSSYQTSGYQALIETYSNYSIPIFFSEYGCNKVMPRPFTEVQAIYSEEMTSVLSGGLAYEYSEESDNPHFGLVQIEGNSVKPLTDFGTLKKQFAANPAPTGTAGAKESGAVLECPAYSQQWQVHGDSLPAMPNAAQKYFSSSSGAGKGPGLNGPGSQTAGNPDNESTGTMTGSVQVSSTAGAGSSTSSGAAASLKPAPLQIAPIVCSAIVVVSTFLGAALL